MEYPRISVVVPSFNHGRYLEATLLSVIEQKYPSLELLVMDGGSTDESVEIIKKHERDISYWISEPDGGQTQALINGFQRSTGVIQCWLNSDDLMVDGSLFEAAEYLIKHPDTDMVFGDTVWIDKEGNSLREQREIPFNRFIWMYTHNYIPGMSAFWRQETYEKVGGLNARYNLSMDADLWIRFAHYGRIAHVRRVWSKMRFYPEQKNRRLRSQSDIEDLEIRKRYWGASKPRFYRSKKWIAQTMRIVWKLLYGCYPIGYKRYLEQN